MTKIKLPILVLLLLLTSILVPSHITAVQPMERVLIMFHDQIAEDLIEKNSGEILEQFPSINAVLANIPQPTIQYIQTNQRVKHIELDEKVSIQTSYWSDWGIEKVQSPLAWQQSLTGQGVKVAVIDTGVSEHSDLHIHKGKSFVGYTNSFTDDNGHGTHVAGIIAAGKNPNGGLKGVAPDVELYVAKVLDQKGEGYHSNVIKAIDWAITNKVDIINLSVGGKESSLTLEIALTKAYNEHNILIVAAAGNSGDRLGRGNTVEYPAAYESVIAVAATESNDQRATFSGNGSAVELAAPGVRIKSTFINNTYSTFDGTSMAAPHVTGMLALLKQAQPSKTNEELRQLIRQYAIDLGVAGKDSLYGFGRIEFPSQIEIEKPILAAPQNIKVVKLNNTEINITWSHPTATIFHMYRNGKLINQLTNEFSFTEKLPTGTYIYEVTAINDLGIESLKAKTEQINISEDVVITAAKYPDVKATDWFISSLHHLQSLNMIGGYPDGTFQPNRFVTRAELVVFLGRALNLNGAQRQTQFPDVSKTSFASGFIQTAAENGLISGFPDGKFYPNETVSREEAAVFFTRAFPLKNKATTIFPDLNQKHYSFASIQLVVGEGIAYGYPDGKFKPKQGVTRAELVTFLSRALKR